MAFNIRNNPEEQGKSPLLGNGTEWVILLISFLVAVVVWFMYNLSQEYSVFLDYPVNIESNLPGYESHTKADQRLIIRGKAAGHYIVKRRFVSEKDPITLKAEGKNIVSSGDSSDRFMIETRFLRRDLSAVLANEVDIEYVVSDSLTFHLMPLATKKVPVRPLYAIYCESQYAMSSPVRLAPDSVSITGSLPLISTIDEVLTDKIIKTDVETNLEGMVSIPQINGITLSVSSVMYSVEVKRYVEETMTLPVTVRNLPAGRKAVILPEQVKLTYRRYYPLSKQIEDSAFSIVVDYNDVIDSSSPYAIPEVESSPGGTFSFSFSPRLVECIILER